VPPPAPESIASRILLERGSAARVGLGVLRLANRRERFLQTAIALLGVGALALLVLVSAWAGSAISSAPIIRSPFRWYLLADRGLVWYMLACAHIWRAALESRGSCSGSP
jgi:hypothetical protein